MVLGGLFSLIYCPTPQIDRINKIDRSKYDKLAFLYLLRLEWQLEHSKRLSNIKQNDMNSLYWDSFMGQVCCGAIIFTQYITSWNDIFSLLCCSKTTYNAIMFNLNFEQNIISDKLNGLLQNIEYNVPNRAIQWYWYSKRIDDNNHQHQKQICDTQNCIIGEIAAIRRPIKSDGPNYIKYMIPLKSYDIARKDDEIKRILPTKTNGHYSQESISNCYIKTMYIRTQIFNRHHQEPCVTIPMLKSIMKKYKTENMKRTKKLKQYQRYLNHEDAKKRKNEFKARKRY